MHLKQFLDNLRRRIPRLSKKWLLHLKFLTEFGGNLASESANQMKLQISTTSNTINLKIIHTFNMI